MLIALPLMLADLPFPIPPLPRAGQRRIEWRAPVNDAALAFAIARVAAKAERPLIVAARDTHEAHALEADLRFFVEDIEVLHLPDWETLPYDRMSPHADIVSQRLATLHRLPHIQRGVLVVPVGTLLQRLPPTSFIDGRVFNVDRGQQLDLASERSRLDAAGYRYVPQVLDPGDFAIRGALLDIYPMGGRTPYRIELLDREVDTIRSFDPETQRSTGTVEQIRLLPGREFPLDETAMRRVRELLRERFDIDARRSPLYQDLREGVAPAGIEYYLPLFFESTATIFDYLPEDVLAVVCPGAFEASAAFLEQASVRYEQRRHDIDYPLLSPAELFLREQELREHLNKLDSIRVVRSADAGFAEAAAMDDLPAPEVPIVAGGQLAAGALESFLSAYPGRVLVVADSAGRREALSDQLAAAGHRPHVVEGFADFAQAQIGFAITVAPLDDGFALVEPKLALLGERQLFPERAGQPRRRRARAGRDPFAIIRDLSEISIGSPIVHIDHGVGRYRGLTRLDVGAAPAEFIEIEYARGDKLYVPVAQLDLVSRYAGADDEHAPLHSLGGDAWARARKRAQAKVRDVAAELLEIQARRMAAKGTGLVIDQEQIARFAATFPFEETADQTQAIGAVLDDLAQATPMDRLVCGDVGFGKTEVALRAAFAVAMSGFQVAVLVPTTLLAEQHFRNFSDRFAEWPIRVEALSRFRSKAQIAAELGRLADGTTDVVVGTHRLLQKDVRFKRLGLVIVDEEQRFGVRQKEQLKALRAQLPLLTLTATPIPRTLNMALAGLRDLSIIATPPQARLAVKTIVSRWDQALIREAVQRELGRGGQIYFVHNEVKSIDRIARELAELVPEARLRVAHGQMVERELETVMLDFHRQRFNVLVCTTIIESGIDNPNANTIIVHRADRFGLAQLHQLRGRVGRSHHRAYAYLLVPDAKSMTADAAKRIDAIAGLEDLGAGFALATQDLEIRGAGELLGEDQSGQIYEIGFSLYSELLERAVRSVRAGRIPDDTELGDAARTEVELHLPALIPADYLPDVHERLTLYKRIASASDDDALRDLKVEMIDRFGLLPDPVKHLFEVATLKRRADQLGIRRIEIGENQGRVDFSADAGVDPVRLIRMIQSQPKQFRMDGPTRLRLTGNWESPAARLGIAQSLLADLAP